ncbi:MAG: class I SAM-dependent methyltransferase [Candidatus Portnoybacteria bacterium]|nr:class I SAM-dependent methyltransferase [Candidatus Portnoybacteria bacterium]MDD5752073.1 class I SAM-dependent methyltransferase [Candidatus Portnoybacteria bacterium]
MSNDKTKKFEQTKEVIKYLLKYVSGKTLDLGAGSAKYRQIIKEKASEYLAFDKFSGPNIDVTGDASNTLFPGEGFDTIISTQLLEHVERPWLVIKEIGRILRKGGICILTAPFINPHHNDPGDYFRYTTSGIKSLFSNENFEIVECDSYGQLFTVLCGFIKFSFLNPYEKSKKGGHIINNLLFKIAKFLNKFTKNKIIYDSVYIVARKK